MRAAIILKTADLKNFNRALYDIVLGADYGALHAIRNNIIPDIAVGDFDSCTEAEFNEIKANVKRIEKLNPIKDMSDTNEAVSIVKDYDEIFILGGIQGKRIEHLFANIIDLINNPRLKILDENSLIETVDTLTPYNVRLNYRFVSIYAIEESLISLSGFKYNLDNYLMKTNDPLGLSNEVISNPKIDLKKGRLLVIYSHGE
ncbi:MAG: thiamine diphosphokinase [Acholeplasmatales bacterium]|nr:thiamine diphosphokinase [Acholeplasmatales bacterium]